MEGPLKKYKNFMSGYTQYYVKLEQTKLIILKDQADKIPRHQLDLRGARIEVNQSNSREFVLTVGLDNLTNTQVQETSKNGSKTDNNLKFQKFFFQSKDPRERDQWAREINESIKRANNIIRYKSLEQDSRATRMSKKALKSHKDSIYDAFSSTLFVDECGINHQLTAFQEIEALFKTDIEVLLDMVKSTIDEDKANPILKKINGIKNQHKTMSSLIKNIVAEIDNTREKMFRILESYAAIEILKNPKKFNRKKQQMQLKNNFNIDDDVQPKKTFESHSSNDNKSSANQDSDNKRRAYFLFEEEKSNDRGTTLDGNQFNYRPSTTNGSNFDDNELQFGLDQEEELFQDANEDLIVQDQQLVRPAKVFIQDILEERISLPHMRNPNQKISFWQVMKDLIGKDLTKVSMPIYFNEPLSLNQRLAETLEYNYLLEKAAEEENSLLRLAYVAAYSGTRYSSVIGRMQKPFNSLLGETYELVTMKYRYVSEQVSHHPPITAYHCQGSNYEVFTQAGTTMRFNGRYVLFAPKDRVYVRLTLKDGTKELFSFNLPATSVHNLIIGKLYIDVNGKSQILNHRTNEVCDIELKEKGWSGKNANQMIGIIKNQQGKLAYKLEGQYTGKLFITDMSQPVPVPLEVWSLNKKPENSDWMYQFSYYTLQLNYLTDALREKLPPTDSRLRPDQRALENGETDLAIREKHRLEEAQRARRKELEKEKGKHVPVFFEENLIEETGEKIFMTNGKYWEDRSNKEWSKLVRIFE